MPNSSTASLVIEEVRIWPFADIDADMRGGGAFLYFDDGAL